MRRRRSSNGRPPKSSSKPVDTLARQLRRLKQRLDVLEAGVAEVRRSCEQQFARTAQIQADLDRVRQAWHQGSLFPH